MNQGKRWLEIDVIRGMCIIGILFLHMTAYFLAPSLAGYNSFKVSLLINQFVRFTLPLFLFFSGFGLAIGYRGGQLKEFYTKRLKTVVLPYVVWSLIYFLFALTVLNKVPFRAGMVSLTGSGLGWLDLLRKFAINLLFGWNYVHLYFVFLIVQFYLIFPLVYRWLAGVSRPGRFLLWMSLIYLIYLVFVAYYRKYLNVPYLTFFYKYYWELAPSWFFYFFGGILAALHLTRFRELSKKYKGLFAVLFLATSTLVLAEAWYKVILLHQGVGSLTSLRPSVFINTVAFVFFLFPLGGRMLKGKLGEMFIFLGNISFSLFFNHLLILALASSWLIRLFPHILGYQRTAFLPVLAGTVICISVAFSVLVTKLPFPFLFGGRQKANIRIKK